MRQLQHGAELPRWDDVLDGELSRLGLTEPNASAPHPTAV
jgi:hypothetical protein